MPDGNAEVDLLINYLGFIGRRSSGKVIKVADPPMNELTDYLIVGVFDLMG